MPSIKVTFSHSRVTVWKGLPDVIERFLQASGASEPANQHFQVQTEDEEVTFDAVDDVVLYPSLPSLTGCDIYVSAGRARLAIRGYNWRGSYGVVWVDVAELDQNEARKLIQFTKNRLGVKEVEEMLTTPAAVSVPSVFLAHSFDNPGLEVADKLRELLQSLGLSVATGESYETRSVSDKVKERIQQQGVVICVFTRPDRGGGEFSQWVRDEGTYALALGKPALIMVERGLGEIPGIHGDLEYIPFERDDLLSAIVKLFQGLKALGFRLSLQAE